MIDTNRAETYENELYREIQWLHEQVQTICRDVLLKIHSLWSVSSSFAIIRQRAATLRQPPKRPIQNANSISRQHGVASFSNYSLTPFLPRVLLFIPSFFLLLLCRRIQHAFGHCCVRNCNLSCERSMREPLFERNFDSTCRPSYLSSENQQSRLPLAFGREKTQHFLQYFQTLPLAEMIKHCLSRASRIRSITNAIENAIAGGR